METEHPFTLPRGYVDSEGCVHREGTMRLATAFDEIAPLKDPRVRSNEAYLVIILLSRVITKLGTLEDINPKVIEGLFSSDLAFLQTFYMQINEDQSLKRSMTCPNCNHEYEVDLSNLGE